MDIVDVPTSFELQTPFSFPEFYFGGKSTRKEMYLHSDDKVPSIKKIKSKARKKLRVIGLLNKTKTSTQTMSR